MCETELKPRLPVLWKYDRQLGIAYYCPHCKAFQCAGKGACTECGGEIDWEHMEEWNRRANHE